MCLLHIAVPATEVPHISHNLYAQEEVLLMPHSSLVPVLLPFPAPKVPQPLFDSHAENLYVPPKDGELLSE